MLKISGRCVMLKISRRRVMVKISGCRVMLKISGRRVMLKISRRRVMVKISGARVMLKITGAVFEKESRVLMATHMKETNKNMTKNLLHRISETSEDLKMMEVTDHFELLHELGTGSYGKVFKGKHKTSGEMMMDENDDHVGMQEDMLKRCVPQIASALNFMHNSGVVHRDVKLDNILLMDAECHWIKLADFGLTRIQGTLVPSLSWCIPYTAPEFCCLRQGEELVLQPSVDVWAFGVLIYIALTGFFPWQVALGRDQQYKEFAWWQVKKDLSEAPGKWKKISTEARGMFWKLLTLNASERCSAMDILNYIHLPWKAEVPSEQIKMNPSFLQVICRPYDVRAGDTSSSTSCILLDHEMPSLTIGAEVEIT
ncbi:serine/threonine-protein kinase SBK1-like [Bufo bufo]|uniref:serine/threonine-protein kinase SBK1-like n=1 Tax=Bufo bufo TaxID=8384 RepID=UPI001ABE17E7|nr:serine/threonine-protein kinase SBK1-like [Bufo bufo]